MSSHKVVKNAKGKFVVKKSVKKPVPPTTATPAKPGQKKPVVPQPPVNNDPQDPPYPPATQPVVVAQKRTNPFSKTQAQKQQQS